MGGHGQEGVGRGGTTSELFSTMTTTHVNDAAMVGVAGAHGQPAVIGGDVSVGDLVARLDRLERKTDAFMHWASPDPFGQETPSTLATCARHSNLKEFSELCKAQDSCPGMYDHTICLDGLLGESNSALEGGDGGQAGDGTAKEKCVVYDFGIRENPEFGETLSGPPFECDVYAFDPSPIAVEWAAKSELVRSRPNYHFFGQGAGGHDGEVELRAYNWGQVSILRAPDHHLSRTRLAECTISECPTYVSATGQEKHALKVRTLASIMNELGHDHVDVLKVDVEGSEYLFLERALDDGVLSKVSQLTVEWHHMGYDTRYGAGSDPHIAAIARLMKDEADLHVLMTHNEGGWAANEGTHPY